MVNSIMKKGAGFVKDPIVKFIFSMKATKIDKIFTADLKICSTCQINGEDFVNFCGPKQAVWVLKSKIFGQKSISTYAQR